MDAAIHRGGQWLVVSVTSVGQVGRAGEATRRGRLGGSANPPSVRDGAPSGWVVGGTRGAGGALVLALGRFPARGGFAAWASRRAWMAGGRPWVCGPGRICGLGR